MRKLLIGLIFLFFIPQISYGGNTSAGDIEFKFFSKLTIIEWVKKEGELLGTAHKYPNPKIKVVICFISYNTYFRMWLIEEVRYLRNDILYFYKWNKEAKTYLPIPIPMNKEEIWRVQLQRYINKLNTEKSSTQSPEPKD